MTEEEYNKEKGRLNYQLSQYQSKINDLNSQCERIKTTQNSLMEVRTTLYIKYPTEYESYASVFDNSLWYGTVADAWNSDFCDLHNCTVGGLISNMDTIDENLSDIVDDKMLEIEALEDLMRDIILKLNFLKLTHKSI